MKSTLMLEAYKLCFNEDFDFEKKSNRKKLQAFVFFMQELGVDFGYHFLGLTTGVTSVSLYKEMPFSAMNNCTDNIRLSEYAIYTIAKLKKLNWLKIIFKMNQMTDLKSWLKSTMQKKT